jgi:hypothetical protein
MKFLNDWVSKAEFREINSADSCQTGKDMLHFILEIMKGVGRTHSFRLLVYKEAEVWPTVESRIL